MNFVAEMKKKAAALQKRLVLPEGTEERTITAAAQIVAEKLAKDKAIFTDAMTNKQQNDLTRKFVHHSFCSTDGVIFLYPININNLINYQ